VQLAGHAANDPGSLGVLTVIGKGNKATGSDCALQEDGTVVMSEHSSVSLSSPPPHEQVALPLVFGVRDLQHSGVATRQDRH
jgi:hypothetical protein